MTALPRSQVCTEAMLDVIGDDRVTAAVFVTFQLQPTFFEEHVLAPLLGVDGRGSARVRRVALEERLATMAPPVVFYDRAGLGVDGSLRQAVRAVPVTLSSGVLHAKHVLLLLEGGSSEEPTSALVLLTTSANLTENGWCTIVEIADIERIERAAATPLKADVLTLLRDLSAFDRHDAHVAIEQIRTFVQGLVQADGLPRLWLGREPLAQFMAQHIAQRDVRLECLAPFIDQEATPIGQLKAAMRARDVVVWMPRDRADAPAASQQWCDALGELDARLGRLDLDRGFGAGSKSLRRFVHAKMIRVRAQKRSWVLAGSPNLSGRAHAGRATGTRPANLETAMLREGRGVGNWLLPIGTTVTLPDQLPPDEDDSERFSRVALRLRYDWAHRQAEARSDDGRAFTALSLGPASAEAGSPARVMFDVPAGDAWHLLDDARSGAIAGLLESTNLAKVWLPGREPGPILIEEIGLEQRPSPFIADLTYQDILKHWALLSVTLRGDNLEEVLNRKTPLDGETVPSRRTDGGMAPGETMFSAFSGIFHAFIVLRDRLDDALDRGRLRSVATRLVGQRHDSLPTLLTKLLESEDVDDARKLVGLLSARELVEHVLTREPALLAEHAAGLEKLEAQLAGLDTIWAGIDLKTGARHGEDPDLFRRWYEAQWLTSTEGGD